MTMDLYETIQKRRSIRRFEQKPIEKEILRKMIDAARLAPSAANLQPLEYIIVTNPKQCTKIFPTISWAGYLKTWTPSLDEQPTGYIAILVNEKNKYYQRDVGLASAYISLIAEAEHIGSCILCNIDKNKLTKILEIPESKTLDSLIALGYKKEHPVLEETDETIKYYLDDQDKLHVPKKPLKTILSEETYQQK